MENDINWAEPGVVEDFVQEGRCPTDFWNLTSIGPDIEENKKQTAFWVPQKSVRPDAKVFREPGQILIFDGVNAKMHVVPAELGEEIKRRVKAASSRSE